MMCLSYCTVSRYTTLSCLRLYSVWRALYSICRRLLYSTVALFPGGKPRFVSPPEMGCPLFRFRLFRFRLFRFRKWDARSFPFPEMEAGFSVSGFSVSGNGVPVLFREEGSHVFGNGGSPNGRSWAQAVCACWRWGTPRCCLPGGTRRPPPQTQTITHGEATPVSLYLLK